MPFAGCRIRGRGPPDAIAAPRPPCPALLPCACLPAACALVGSVSAPGRGWQKKNAGLSSVLPARAGAPRLGRSMSSLPPHTVLAMPALSPTMTTGNIATFKFKVGDKV